MKKRRILAVNESDDPIPAFLEAVYGEYVHLQTTMFDENHCLKEATRIIDELREKVRELERGEYICKKCGLRKDGESPPVEF